MPGDQPGGSRQTTQMLIGKAMSVDKTKRYKSMDRASRRNRRKFKSVKMCTGALVCAPDSSTIRANPMIFRGYYRITDGTHRFLPETGPCPGLLRHSSGRRRTADAAHERRPDADQVSRTCPTRNWKTTLLEILTRITRSNSFAERASTSTSPTCQRRRRAFSR